MHCRNCWDSKRQTGPEAAGIAGAAGAAGASEPRLPLKSALPIIEPATEPAADDAKVPIKPGPADCVTGGGACCAIGAGAVDAGRKVGALEGAGAGRPIGGAGAGEGRALFLPKAIASEASRGQNPM